MATQYDYLDDFNRENEIMQTDEKSETVQSFDVASVVSGRNNYKYYLDLLKTDSGFRCRFKSYWDERRGRKRRILCEGRFITRMALGAPIRDAVTGRYMTRPDGTVMRVGSRDEEKFFKVVDTTTYLVDPKKRVGGSGREASLLFFTSYGEYERLFDTTFSPKFLQAYHAKNKM